MAHRNWLYTFLIGRTIRKIAGAAIMELHKQLKIDKNKYNLSLQDNPLDYFAKAMDFVLEYYSEDFNRIANTKFSEVSPEFFLREMSWCVCVSGFSAKVVSKFFPRLMEVLDPFFVLIADTSKTHEEIHKDPACYPDKQLRSIFNSGRKIDAIIGNALDISVGIRKIGWEEYKNTKLNVPLKLQSLRMVGPAIAQHLARNIGVDAVKEDVHLVRAANHWGFPNALELCKAIQSKYDIRLGLIDLVLWYAFSTFGSK
jgi:hypothetical protein